MQHLNITNLNNLYFVSAKYNFLIYTKIKKNNYPLHLVSKHEACKLSLSLRLCSKRMKRADKNGKGLRHFSMKVCEKVQKKGTTSYNEVADELVAEFTHASSLMPADSVSVTRSWYDFWSLIHNYGQYLLLIMLV